MKTEAQFWSMVDKRTDGEWPTGTWWGYEAGDVWPLHPILWKPIP